MWEQLMLGQLMWGQPPRLSSEGEAERPYAHG